MSTLFDTPVDALEDRANFQSDDACYSVRYVETEMTKDQGVFVRGFASTNSKDRHGHVINPALFSLHEYRKNPQVWVNHKLYLDEFGNGHAVGKTVEIHAVRVANINDATKRMDLYSLETSELVRAGVPTEGLLVKNDLRGLWVVCHVTHPAVVADVMNKELNAFSWSGTVYSKPNGQHAVYDLHEISLVHLPANAWALFQIGKSLYTEQQDLATNTPVTLCIELDAVKALLTNGVHNRPDSEEDTLQKGGETVDEPKLEDVLKTLTDVGAAVKGVSDQLAAVDSRISALEASATKAATETPVAPVEPVAPAAATETDASKSASAEGGNTELVQTLSKLADTTSKALENFTSLAKRVEALETQTVASKGATDDEEPTEEEVRKALHSLTPEERRAIDKRLLANSMVPKTAASRVAV